MNVGGGYYSVEFDLEVINQYIDTPETAPEPYRSLLDIWNSGEDNRNDASILRVKKARTEGRGRTIRKTRKT